ncbi:MAG: TniQ family protein [Betaproteobacteria bacterium]|nr:TniQ family protein [Betaproteobacteria bacterium]
MDDLGKLDQFFLVLPEALRNAASSRQNIDQFGRGLSEVLGLEIGRSNPAPFPSDKGSVIARDFEPTIPALLPNEILQGWRGRVAAVNCRSNIRDAEHLLLTLGKQKMPSLGDDPDFVQCAAAVLGIAPQDLIRSHTLTPFFDTLGDLKQNKPGRAGRHLRAYQRRAPFRIDSKHALFCRQCVEEDLAFWKFSYWRCSHHLPGVHCCGTHATPLLSAGGHDSFERCPHHFLEATIEERTAPQSAAAAAILLRYAQIAAEILERAPTIDSSAASFILGQRAKVANLRISGAGSRTTLSTHIMETVPLAWLQETFPRVRWCQL